MSPTSGDDRYGDAARRTARHGNGQRSWLLTYFRNRASFIHGRAIAARSGGQCLHWVTSDKTHSEYKESACPSVADIRADVVFRRFGSTSSQQVTTSAGRGLVATPLSNKRTALDRLVIAGGPGIHDAAVDSKLLDWVRARAASVWAF
jgi:hypothetical protein